MFGKVILVVPDCSHGFNLADIVCCEGGFGWYILVSFGSGYEDTIHNDVKAE